MIHQFTVDVSAALLEFMTNEVAAVMLATGADRKPCVPPGVLQETKIVLPAATAVVFTVTVPATRVAVPMLAFAPVAILILFPADNRARFPVISTLSVGAVVDPNPIGPTCVLVVFVPV